MNAGLGLNPAKDYWLSFRLKYLKVDYKFIQFFPFSHKKVHLVYNISLSLSVFFEVDIGFDVKLMRDLFWSHCSWAITFRFERLFSKSALLGQKSALNLWYVYTRLNSQKLYRSFESLSYLAYKIQKKIMFSYIFYSHNSNRPFQ